MCNVNSIEVQRLKNEVSDLTARLTNLETLVEGLMAEGFKVKKGSDEFIDALHHMWEQSSASYGAPFKRSIDGIDDLFAKVKS